MRCLLLATLAVSAAGAFTSSPRLSRTAASAAATATPLASATTPSTLSRSPRIGLPQLPTHLALPAVSYSALGGVAIGVTKLLMASGVQAAGVLGLVGVSVGFPVAMVLSPVLMSGGQGVAKSLGGVPTTSARLKALADEAASAVGVKPPHVYELASKEPNAFAASGLLNGDTTVAVTRGLTEILSWEEIGAVLAHEMGHLRHRDVVRNMHIAAAAAGLGGLYDVGRALLRSERRSSKKKDDDSGGQGLGLALMAAGVATEAAAHLVRLAASRGAELRADRAAAKAFGSQTLISALKKIDAHAARRPADLRDSNKAFAHLMISDGPTAKPKGNGFMNALRKIGNSLRTHPTLDKRVEALENAERAGLVPAHKPGVREPWF